MKNKIKKQIEKNILECPYNKTRQDKNHKCSDCDTENDILKAQLKGFEQGEKKILEKIKDLIIFKVNFVEDKCKGKERGYRYYELANLRDWLDDELKK